MEELIGMLTAGSITELVNIFINYIVKGAVTADILRGLPVPLVLATNNLYNTAARNAANELADMAGKAVKSAGEIYLPDYSAENEEWAPFQSLDTRVTHKMGVNRLAAMDWVDIDPPGVGFKRQKFNWS